MRKLCRILNLDIVVKEGNNVTLRPGDGKHEPRTRIDNIVIPRLGITKGRECSLGKYRQGSQSGKEVQELHRAPESRQAGGIGNYFTIYRRTETEGVIYTKCTSMYLTELK